MEGIIEGNGKSRIVESKPYQIGFNSVSNHIFGCLLLLLRLFRRLLDVGSMIG